MDEETEEFLSHHGIKGMHWGIRKQHELKTDSEAYSAQLKAKYGPDSLSNNKKFHLTSKEKAAATAAAALVGYGVLVGGVGYILSKEHINPFADSQHFTDLMSAGESENLIKSILAKASDAPVSDFTKGLAQHWEKGVGLPAGSIIQRLSTVKETAIKSEGFYGAFSKRDIQAYKGNLPANWRMWGQEVMNGGYLTQIKSAKAISAPSGKESVEIYKQLIHENPHLLKDGPFSFISSMKETDKNKAIDGLAKTLFPKFSHGWIEPSDPVVSKYFDMVRAKGYNALIDFNDAGRIAKTPLRLLNSDEFKITGHIHVPPAELVRSEIRESLINRIKHNTAQGGENVSQNATEFLSHHGVKGMHWGIRKDKGHAGEQATTKTIKKLDRQYIRAASSKAFHTEILTSANKAFIKKDLPGLNKKYASQDIANNPSANRAYISEAQAALVNRVAEAAWAKGASASGRYHYAALQDMRNPAIFKISAVKTENSFSHNSEPARETLVLNFNVSYEANGLISDIQPGNIDEPVSHSMLTEEFLSHYGVKGMHWGIRNTKMRTPASTDAKKAYALKSRPIHSLSNKQLKTLNERMNLESNNRKLNPSKAMTGKKKVELILGSVGLAVGAYNLVKSPAGQAAANLGKRFMGRPGYKQLKLF